jgi:hypothetical protein
MPARRRKPSAPGNDPHLLEEQSARLRDQLIADIERIGSGDEAAMWAQGKRGTKNTLMPADAGAVESAFAQKLLSLEESQIDPGIARNDNRPNGSEPGQPGAAETPLPVSVDESRPILQKASGCATRSIGSLSQASLASCAVVRRPTRTIGALPSRAPSAAGSATSSLFRSAGLITANSTATATRRLGGRPTRSDSIRPQALA